MSSERVATANVIIRCPTALSARTAQALILLSLLFAIWVLCNAYYESKGSSLIYAARAWADLDPSGIGRDPMFRLDGQSSFTLFTLLFRFIMQLVGTKVATQVLAACSVVASFAGAAILATTVCAGRTRVLALVYAAALPAYYGGYKIFSYAEAAASPRPFAEALVLCGLAALIERRLWLAMATMVAAAALHPIMALPGVLVLVIWLVLVDWRWIWPMAAAMIATAIAAAASLPPFDRLATLIDPAWQAVLIERNPHLFPSLWPPGWLGRAAARFATLIVAASLTSVAIRKLFISSMLVGITGLAIAYLLNNAWPVVLLVQAQTWRTMWLVFSLATFAGAICTMQLWPRGGTARIVLVLLAASWVDADYDRAAMLLAATALTFHFCIDPRQFAFSERLTWWIVAAAAPLIIFGLMHNEFVTAHSVGDVPTDLAEEARRVIAWDWDYTPVAVVAACYAIVGRDLSRSVLFVLALLAVVLSAATWDRRSALNRFFDANIGVPNLTTLIDEKPGEILWLDGDRESWSWLGRPNWISPLQGAGLVFSRPLAMLYRDRADLIRQSGLDESGRLAPFADVAKMDPHQSKPEMIDAFCAKPDAPAWIIRPLADNQPLLDGLRSTVWNAPIASLEPIKAADDRLTWRRVSRYNIIQCAR